MTEALRHAPFVWGAYAAAALILGVMVAATLLRARAVRRDLAAAEQALERRRADRER